MTGRRRGSRQSEANERSQPEVDEENKKHDWEEEAEEGDGIASDEEEQMQSFLSEEANKGVRDKYQRLMNVIHQHADEQTNLDIHNLQLLVLEANEAFTSVKRPREAALDAQLLKVCGDMAKHNIESSQSSIAVFNPREFGEKLVTFVSTVEDVDDDDDDDEEMNLISKVGLKAFHLFNTIPGVEPLYSAMEWEKPLPERKNRNKQMRDGAVQEAQKVAVLKDHEGEEEAEAVSWMFKILKQCFTSTQFTPLPFFNFVLDPSSFPRSVENLFYVSLLIREQYAEIIEDEDGHPVILPAQSTGNAIQAEDRQCILSMDMMEWKKLIKLFNISHAMIPPKGLVSKKRK